MDDELKKSGKIYKYNTHFILLDNGKKFIKHFFQPKNIKKTMLLSFNDISYDI